MGLRPCLARYARAISPTSSTRLSMRMEPNSSEYFTDESILSSRAKYFPNGDDCFFVGMGFGYIMQDNWYFVYAFFYCCGILYGMSWERRGKKVSAKLTDMVRGGHGRRVLITDKDNKTVLHFPVLFFVIVTLLLPVVVGVLIFLFLLSEYHAVVEKVEE